MKTLQLKAEDLGAGEILTKEELKNTLVYYPNELLGSGSGSGTGAGCSASVSCPGGGGANCSCTNDTGSCSSTSTSISCNCGSGAGISYTCPTAGSGSGSGSGSGGGSGGSAGSGSSGGGSGGGSGSGSGGGFWVKTENNTSSSIPIYIDAVVYMCPVGLYTQPILLSTGNHNFDLPCTYLGTVLNYKLNDVATACGSNLTKYINSNITIKINS